MRRPRLRRRAPPWPEWAAHSVSYRIETMRRFANEVRAREQDFADIISRETGKPYWEAQTEVGAVVNKVDISANAYLERTGMRKLEAAMGSKVAVRHKPHGVLAVLGPYNFPAHLPNGHIVPALIAGNAIVFKPSEKTPATGVFLVDCLRAAGVPEGVVRVLIGGPEQGKALAGQPGIDGLLFTGSARAGMALAQAICRHAAQDAGAGTGRQQSAGGVEGGGHRCGGADRGPVGLSVGRPALHRGAAADRRGWSRGAADRGDLQADRSDHRRPSPCRPAAVHGPGDRPGRRRPSAVAIYGADDEGRKADPAARPAVRGAALSHPRADRRDRRQRSPRRGDVRAGAADDPGQGFRCRDRRGEQYAVRPGREFGRRNARRCTTSSGPMSAPG